MQTLRVSNLPTHFYYLLVSWDKLQIPRSQQLSITLLKFLNMWKFSNELWPDRSIYFDLCSLTDQNCCIIHQPHFSSESPSTLEVWFEVDLEIQYRFQSAHSPVFTASNFVLTNHPNDPESSIQIIITKSICVIIFSFICSFMFHNIIYTPRSFCFLRLSKLWFRSHYYNRKKCISLLSRSACSTRPAKLIGRNIWWFLARMNYSLIVMLLSLPPLWFIYREQYTSEEERPLNGELAQQIIYNWYTLVKIKSINLRVLFPGSHLFSK